MRLQSGDIVLRRYADADRDGLVALGDNPNVSRGLSSVFPSPYTMEEAVKWTSYASRQDPLTDFAVEWNGVLAGGIGLMPMRDDYRGTVEVGYWLGEPYWGKGLASRAVALVVPYAMETLGFIRMQAIVHTTNPASMRVLEKNGFAREGLLRKFVRKKDGEARDVVLYARV